MKKSEQMKQKVTSEAAEKRQNSDYKDGKAKPDNNIFHEGKSNPLSSKGN